jgi:hypothetical protein
MTVERRSVGSFDQVRFSGPGVLKISQGVEGSLTIHAPSYVMEHIRADVTGNELQVGYRSPRVVALKIHREVVSYDLKVKELRRLRVTGVGRVVVPDLDNDRVRVDVTGSGHVVLDHLTADQLEVVITGAGTVSVRGDVESQSVVISGAGHYGATQLISDFAQLKVTGAGVADISVSTDLDVVISGAGKVSYGGYPEIVKRISGAGKLSRRRRSSRQQSNGEEHG